VLELPEDFVSDLFAPILVARVRRPAQALAHQTGKTRGGGATLQPARNYAHALLHPAWVRQDQLPGGSLSAIRRELAYSSDGLNELSVESGPL
jgi:hypothetical protein